MNLALLLLATHTKEKQASSSTVIHFAKDGSRDPVTGLAFGFSGRHSHPLRPTLLAHRDHTRPFFDDTETMTLGSMTEADLDVLDRTNATIQSWHLNRFMGSLNVTTILAAFHHSGTGAAALLQRLADVGLSEVPNDLVDSPHRSEAKIHSSPSFQLIRVRQTCLDLGLNWETLAKVRNDEDLKWRLKQFYLYRLLTYGRSLHQQAASSGKPFSLKESLRERCHDPSRPTWLPARTRSKQGPMMQIGRSTCYHFANDELFLEARGRLFEVLRESQEAQGADWVLVNKQAILDEWFERYYAEVEQPTLADWKEVEGRPELTRQIAKKRRSAKGGSPDQLIHCLTTSIALYAPDAPFARKI